MPTAVKTADNMAKHLTREELEVRRQAEAETLPDRGRGPRLKKPGFVRLNRAANGYWNQIVKRMEGLAILDDLDCEVFAGYCSMLARRDQTIRLVQQLMERLGVQGADAEELTPDEILEAVAKLDSLTGKLQTLERNLLQYADKLGLTPSGRVRLARKRAEQMAVDPDGDLFGD